jgi:hypothetical protein
MKCASRESKRYECTCTYEPCPRKGICCECIHYHLSMRQAPACLFSAAAERIYDRSFEALVDDLKGKG